MYGEVKNNFCQTRQLMVPCWVRRKLKKLSSGLECLFLEQFTAEHHVFVFDFFCNGGSKDFELAIYL